ncbi:MAG: 50S ribosomal protein L21 [Leptolyngbyaceae cyanobacterium SL_7_1]|nr:50S ribosomal protein L21 [Leptolyngbyaceae cyanobacterium SL_7_1]
MPYAIIETGGKQLRVEPGRFYDIERLAVNEEDVVTIDRVLFIENDGDVSIGQPLVAGATVTGQVLRHLRGRKIIVYKMRPKKKTRKKQGHRQELTRLMIESIQLNGVVLASSEATSGESPVKTATASSVADTETTVEPVEAAVETSTLEATPVEVVE